MKSGVRFQAYKTLGAILFLSPLATQGAERPVEYELDLRSPASHLVKVHMTIPDSKAGTAIQFPAWNALYQIRDFVRWVQNLDASCDGEAIHLDQVDQNTWRGVDRNCTSLRISYEVLANEEGVFSSVLNDQHAFLNLALVLFYLPQDRARSVTTRYLVPEGWKLATLLEDGAQSGEFRAANYDELVDSPVEAGNFREFNYDQKGATYRLIVHADPADYSPERLLDSTKKITQGATDLMQDVPCRRYTFILHFPRAGGGGMEHRNGTAVAVSQESLKSGLGLEAVVAHEFFHAWDVKRIRPQNLEPVDYVHGNDTSDLWFAEGVDSAFQEYILLRAGLISRQVFYEHLAGSIKQLQDRPARLMQSAEQSGREAWLEKYADYLRPERSISYYNKGALLGFLLDLEMRHATEGRRGLPDLMRRLNSDFARRGRLFTRGDLITEAENLAPSGDAYRKFFDDYVSGTKEFDYNLFLSYAGLRLVASSKIAATLGWEPVQGLDQPITAASVDPGGNAYEAGLRDGDTIEDMDGKALESPDSIRSGKLKAGRQVSFRVRRDEQVLTVQYTLEPEKSTSYKIQEIKQATPEQRRLRDAWLNNESAPAAEQP